VNEKEKKEKIQRSGSNISREWMEPTFLQKQWLTEYMAEEEGLERGVVSEATAG
jgi:hypothetical protein